MALLADPEGAPFGVIRAVDGDPADLDPVAGEWLWRELWAEHAAPEEFRVFPKRRLPVDALSLGCEVVVPPLIKGYLRAGGRLIGEPHHDVEFGCADLPMLLALDRIEARYSRRFLRSA